MDPNEYAFAYDQNIIRALANSQAFSRVRGAILGRCLQFDKSELTEP